MNDARLADLLRMAVEVDELERDCAPGVDHAGVAARIGDDTSHAERGGTRAEGPARAMRWVLWGSGLMAAAACVGLVVGGAMLARMPGEMARSLAKSMSPGPTLRDQLASAGNGGLDVEGMGADRPGVGVIVAGGEGETTGPAFEIRSAVARGAEEHCCVVVALVRDAGGGLGCVRWRQHEWDVDRVSAMGALDLKTAVAATCPPTGEGVRTIDGRQVVLVAIAGPTRLLPRTDERAAELAMCILGSPRPCETEGMCFTGAAARCLPNELSVKVETVALR